jgi:hypothetical protein
MPAIVTNVAANLVESTPDHGSKTLCANVELELAAEREPLRYAW